jgi:hypothetical protein
LAGALGKLTIRNEGAAAWGYLLIRATPITIRTSPPRCTRPTGSLKKKWSIAVISRYPTETVGKAVEMENLPK